jgi:dsDNA-binding SOS-regulon protein
LQQKGIAVISEKTEQNDSLSLIAAKLKDVVVRIVVEVSDP